MHLADLRALLTRPLPASSLVVGLGCTTAAVALLGQVAHWHWTLESAAHFPLQYAVVLGLAATGLAVLPGAFADPRRRWAVAFGLLAFHQVYVWLQPFDPPAVPSVRGQAPLRVVQLNLRSENRDFAGVRAFLRQARADVVGLQEVTPRWQRELEPLGDVLPHAVVQARADNFGVAVLSRHPLQDARIEYLGRAGVPTVTAQLTWQGVATTLVVTHPLPPVLQEGVALRDDQLAHLAAYLRQRTGPALLVGDLNVTPWARAFAQLLSTAGLANTARAGLPGTWPAQVPPLRIPLDHVLVRGLTVLQREVGPEVGSDHLPVVVDLARTPDRHSRTAP